VLQKNTARRSQIELKDDLAVGQVSNLPVVVIAGTRGQVRNLPHEVAPFVVGVRPLRYDPGCIDASQLKIR
jgi:hypothetical protein